MSELKTIEPHCSDLRGKLLVTVSALALISSALGSSGVLADSADDKPAVWIELGAQLERQTGQGDVLTQPFIANNSASPAFAPVSPFHIERPPLYGNGAQGKLTFQPHDFDWVFSVSALYGRSNGNKQLVQRQPLHKVKEIGHYYSHGNHRFTEYVTLPQADFSLVSSKQSQSRAVLDFQAGKDVGVGLFGSGSTSVVGVGVRYAEFSSRGSFAIHAAPDVKTFNGFGTYFANQGYYFPSQAYNSFAGAGRSARSFHGVGPSLTWNGSIPVIGNRDTAAIDLDFGIDAAVLFGRQRASGTHQTSARHVGNNPSGAGATPPYTRSGSFDRKHAAIIPNFGAFAGASVVLRNAKLSLGYRGDFFFGAMDTGNDIRTTKTVGFYGPFATISVGLGG